ncbi:MAG: hypothetical protein AB1695_09245 [Stygiobacter sp.]|uniref:Uncharacterized protein n=1 Tax=Stygiobacter electus TaxID=3032292 RepID=A0AAE3TCS1_9BACT|nr:hypothetical protein [Stygiobacter electus]MDF1612225.1 hypothetical protein [Stygiobacter electus]
MLKNFLLTVLILLFVSNVSFSQSDFEKVEKFKSRIQQIESAIKNASSLDQLTIISDNIEKAKKDFLNDKELIDKSIYPESFTSSFEKLERSLELRKGDFTQITELKTEVVTLKDKISELSQENQGLLSQIRLLNIKSKKDAETISSLQKLVAQLKANIQQRDLLVRGIVDSLLNEFIKYPTTSDVEKQNIFGKVESSNLFYNIERTIDDNIQFMKATKLTPEDLGEMKKQYHDFNKVWRQIGPKLAEVYLSKKDKTMQISNIDAKFTDWNLALNDEMWGQVNKLFREKKIALLPFSSGDQFFKSVQAFVDDELKNYDVKSKEEVENTFYAFTDSVYFKTVEPVWIPVLIENNMMTEANKDSIDAQLAKWKKKVAPAYEINWVYVGGGAVIILLLIALFIKGRNKKTPSSFTNIKEEDNLV